MAHKTFDHGRRRVLLGGLALSLHAPAALAQGRGLPPPQALTVAAEGLGVRVWARRPRGRARGAILFVHGRTWSSRPNFDLTVNGGAVSVLKSFADRGFAAFAMDLPGYGETPRPPSGLLTPALAGSCVNAVLGDIAAREGAPPVLVGYSRGSQVALLTAAAYPQSASMLVLYGFGGLGYAPAQAPPAVARREPTTLAAAASDFIVKDAAAPGVVEAYAAAAVKADPVKMDWAQEAVFTTTDPAKVKVPTLILTGAADPANNVERQGPVFARLGTAAKGWTVLPNADHAAHVEKSHGAWVAAIADFWALNGGR